MRRKRSVLAIALLGLSTAFAPDLAAEEPAELTVVVEAIREAKGRIHVGVWADPESFTEENGRIAGSSAPVDGDTATLTIKGLPPGTYAIAAYHDANGNGDFDLTWIGLPAEGFGFSNGARVTVLGAPSFEAAAIELKGPGTQTVIPLSY